MLSDWSAHVDFAREATAQTDQAVGMRREQFLVDPRPVMESVEMRRGNQFYQVAVTGLILGQQGEMIGAFALMFGRSLCEPRAM